jgi:hypothetical protein
MFFLANHDTQHINLIGFTAQYQSDPLKIFCFVLYGSHCCWGYDIPAEVNAKVVSVKFFIFQHHLDTIRIRHGTCGSAHPITHLTTTPPTASSLSEILATLQKLLGTLNHWQLLEVPQHLATLIRSFASLRNIVHIASMGNRTLFKLW